jgi:hypothetical protein
MPKSLQWKWVIGGAFLMIITTSLVTYGLVMLGATYIDQLGLIGLMIMTLAGPFLGLILGGWMIGFYSEGETIWEAGIAAAVALVGLFAVTGKFDLWSVVIGFVAALLGGFLGERTPGHK